MASDKARNTAYFSRFQVAVDN